MKLNSNALAEQEAKKPSASQDKEQEKEDSMVTLTKAPRKPSPPLILRKKPPSGSRHNEKTPEGNLERVLFDQERSKPKTIHYDQETHKNLLPI